MRQALIALSLLFSSTACQAQPAEPIMPPADAASVSADEAGLVFVPPVNDNAALGGCFTANAAAIPANASPQAKSVHAMLASINSTQAASFQLSNLTVCDGMAATLDYVLTAEAGSLQQLPYTIESDRRSAGEDVVRILASQTNYYLQIPVDVGYQPMDMIRLVRAHMGHRMWQIVKAAEDMAANGEPSALQYLTSETTRNSQDVITRQLGQFTHIYRQYRSDNKAAAEAYVSTVLDLQKPESNFFDPYDMATALIYLQTIVARDMAGRSDPIGFLPIEPDIITRTYRDVSAEQAGRLLTTTVTSPTPQVREGLDMLKDPEILAPKVQPQQQQRLAPRTIIA